MIETMTTNGDNGIGGEATTAPAETAEGGTVGTETRERARAALAECEGLRAELEAAIGPDIWKLVFRYGEAKERAEASQHDHEIFLMIDGIAAHFPGVGAAVRCVGQHLFESDYGRGDECGVVAYPPGESPGTI